MYSSVTSVRLCLLAVSTLGAFAQQVTPPAPDNLPPGMPLVIRDLDRAATDAAKNPTDIGYTLGVFTREKLAWTKSYGFADPTRQSPATADTEYRVGAGAFTAVMLLQLTRDRAVHFSDPVERYLPEIRSVHNPYPGASPVTLLQLALHTSGLALNSTDAATNSTSASTPWEKTLLAALTHATYDFEPGTHAEPSNIDEPILALALSRAARQPYSEYLKQKILLPLGMTHTDFPASGSDDASGRRPVLFSTVGDLARFASFMLLGGPETVLSRSLLEENYRRLWVTNSISIPDPNEGYGIGFHGETWTSNHTYFILPIGDTGPGYEAALWFEPRRHAGMILLHHGPGGPALGQMIHSYVYTLNAQKNDAGPQEPVRPFPYTEEDVSFENPNAQIKLAGSLTVPPGKGPFPALVLIPRAGPFDRDERLLNHRLFFVLADHLTRAGFAVLRVDVRGVGKSGGKFAGTSTDDSAADAEAALAYLRTRPEVDRHKIGLVSHGEGGLVAPIVAARNRDVAFIVMLGAPAVPSAENSVESTRLNAKANGTLYRKADEQAAQTSAIFALLRQENDPATLDRKLRELLAGKMPDAQIAGQIRQLTSPAIRRALTYDPAAALKQLACPILALYAEKDLSVPAALNLTAMRAALESSGTKNFQVEEAPDVGLLFQTADIGIGREANWTAETISPVVLKKIADWLLQQVVAR